MLERMKHADGLGAIYPPMQYSIMALDVLGYPENSGARGGRPAVRKADGGRRRNAFLPAVFFAGLGYRDCAYALGESGYAGADAALAKAAGWLRAREIRRKGDWSMKRPGTEPSGWAFEFQNDWYPDIDDTAMVMLAFPRLTKAKRLLARHRLAAGDAIERRRMGGFRRR